MVYVPQGNRVFGKLTVQENLEMGGYVLKGKRELNRRIETVFARYPMLASKRSLLASSLSGGERQMLSLANILILSPQLLLLDEPSLGLSPSLAKEAFEDIVELNRTEGITVLIVEQKVREALKLAHRVYLLRLGQVAYAGSASELLDSGRLPELFL